MGGAGAMGWSSLLLLMAGGASDLTLPFGESSRPRLCSPGASASWDMAAARGETTAQARGGSPWDRVRQQHATDLCLGLARGQIRLAREPGEALTAARRLAREWPGRHEPRVLEARALLRSGDAAASWEAWQTARALGFDRARDPGGDPASAHALRDYAVAAVLTGHGEIAGAVYRRLVSLLDAWPDARHVQRIYLEAAAVALRHGPAQLDEAVGYLSAAESSATSTGLRAYAAGMRALVQARRGASPPETSRVDAPEVWHFVGLARADQPPSYWPAVPRHEAYAVASLLVERYSSTEASELWDRYVSGLDPKAVDPAVSSFARERQARLARAAGSP
jgi:hypothetical protein